MQDREFHAVANIFPLMSDAEIDDLAADIRANGQRDPIWIHPESRAIVDGRNRFLACGRIGEEPRVRSWDENRDGALVPFVISLNLKRRHLSESQRAMVAANVANLDHGGDRKSGEIKSPIGGLKTSQAEAAALLNVGKRSVERARAVQEKAAPELVEAVQQGRASVSAAAELADLMEEQQREIVAKGEKEILKAAKEIREERKAQGLKTLQSSESNEWYTPDPYVEAARELMGGIDLDPASCSKANETVGAAAFYSQENDGLSQEWAGRVWLNPPYGRNWENESNQGVWSRRLRQQHEAGSVSSAVLLVNAVTDRNWFAPLWGYPICFVSDRIKFYAPDNRPASPTHGSAIVYLGSDLDRFVEIFSRFGQCVLPCDGYSEAA